MGYFEDIGSLLRNTGVLTCLSSCSYISLSSNYSYITWVSCTCCTWFTGLKLVGRLFVSIVWYCRILRRTSLFMSGFLLDSYVSVVSQSWCNWGIGSCSLRACSITFYVLLVTRDSYICIGTASLRSYTPMTI